VKITTADGKYTFWVDECGRLYCDRYDDKKWMEFDEGSKAITTLMYELEAAREKIEELAHELLIERDG
jgi:hypothetical protein